MNTLKALWANALLWLIRPALEEQQRRDDAYEEAFMELLEEKVHKPHREQMFLEMQAAHEERQAFEARHAARKAARAARAAESDLRHDPLISWADRTNCLARDGVRMTNPESPPTANC